MSGGKDGFSQDGFDPLIRPQRKGGLAQMLRGRGYTFPRLIHVLARSAGWMCDARGGVFGLWSALLNDWDVSA